MQSAFHMVLFIYLSLTQLQTLMIFENQYSEVCLCLAVFVCFLQKPFKPTLQVDKVQASSLS